MSSRSDSVLLTGMNSGSINKVERSREKERQRQEEKLKVKATIHKSVIPVLEELKKEKDRTTLELLEVIDGNTDEANVKAVTVSLKLYRTSMDKLASRLGNIMRARPPKQEASDE